MKILYVSASKIPSKDANSVHVMKMCQAFALEGNEVTLLARKGEIKSIEDDYQYYGVSDNFQIKKLSFFAGIFGKISYLLMVFWHIIRSGKKYDLIYGRFLYGIWATSLIGVPFCYESHECQTGFIGRKIEKSIFRSSNMKSFIVISDALKRIYKESYSELLKDKKIIVAHDGADIPSIKKGKQKEDKTLKIGYVGSLYKGRGLELIIDLAKNFPEMEFHILGGKKEDVTYYKSNTKSSNISFYGSVPHSQVGDYLVNFDIVLAPYQKEVSIAKKGINTVEWMSPLKIFEYMSYGKAIICSDLPVIKEVLENNRNSLLCDPEDSNDWIIAINKLKDKNTRNSLGENARKDLKNKYTWQKRAKKVLEV
jgi:glycosyltransferase involved in cell wall biosynthesis